MSLDTGLLLQCFAKWFLPIELWQTSPKAGHWLGFWTHPCLLQGLLCVSLHRPLVEQISPGACRNLLCRTLGVPFCYVTAKTLVSVVIANAWALVRAVALQISIACTGVKFGCANRFSYSLWSDMLKSILSLTWGAQKPLNHSAGICPLTLGQEIYALLLLHIIES